MLIYLLGMRLFIFLLLSSALFCIGAGVDDLRKAAEQGITEAQCKLGVMYDTGQGVPEDDVEAVKWYRKAAEQGIAEAQCNLGFMYDTGQGVAEDEVEAVKWYRKAADQGYADAQYNLGSSYANGQGVAQHGVMAYMWWNLAAAQGDEGAKRNKGILSERMTREQIDEAQQLSREWLAKRQK